MTDNPDQQLPASKLQPPRPAPEVKQLAEIVESLAEQLDKLVREVGEIQDALADRRGGGSFSLRQIGDEARSLSEKARAIARRGAPQDGQ